MRTLTGHGWSALAASGRGALLALLATADRSRAVVPAYTCNAVAEAAGLAGVQVDPVDTSDGYNLSPRDIADAAGPDSVVVATHQYGIPCRIEEVTAVARDSGAIVIEDCAGGLGGRSEGQRLGSFADASFFSFDMSKLIQVPPKGGALTIRDPAWSRRAERWLQANTAPMSRGRKASGLARAALLAASGPYSYRLLHTAVLSARGIATTESPHLRTEPNRFYDAAFAEWQAGVALEQLDRLDQLAAEARRMYGTYREGLGGCRSIDLPPDDEHEEWAPVRFPILVRGDKLEFYRRCVSRGADCAFSFTHLAPHERPSRAEELAGRVLCLPLYPGLRLSEVRRVIEVVRDVDRGWTP